MTYDEFVRLVIDCVKLRVDHNETTVKVNDITKLNGVKLKGLTIIEPGINISPTIYLERFYDEFQAGECIDDIIDKIMFFYTKNKMDTNFDISTFTDFDVISQKVVLGIINTERNIELLESIPNIPFLDLSIIFYVFLSDEFSIMIKNEHMKIWDVDISDLYTYAKANSIKLKPYKISKMDELLGFDSGLELYIVSTTNAHRGSFYILFNEIFDKFPFEIYIIPCSVHELIIMPKEFIQDIEMAKRTIKEVNETELSEEDILSDSLYYYNKETRNIELV